MDLLLCNHTDQTPVIGEIKADTDVNPFLGLIQSLMYAVELSTPAQRARLCTYYPGQFAESDTGSGIDISLILRVRSAADRWGAARNCLVGLFV